MAKTNNDLEHILRALNKAGLSSEYIRSTMPEWWDNAVTQNPVGLAEFKLLLARNLGVHIPSLSGSEPKLTFELPHIRKLKRAKRYNEEQLTPTMSIALSAARVAAAACPIPFKPLPSSLNLRSYILDNLRAKYVSLKSLVIVCWQHGIPVIHVSNYPSNLAKMDGMVANINQRPVIVLSKQTHFNAWMSFILAHEMGHLSLGHCTNGALLVDEDMQLKSPDHDKPDPEESAADQYALKLLGGDENIDNVITSNMTLREMADAAMSLQRTMHIDAGHVLLRHAFNTANWNKVIATLKGIDLDDPINKIKFGEKEYLDTNMISESSRNFLYKMTSMGTI